MNMKEVKKMARGYVQIEKVERTYNSISKGPVAKIFLEPYSDGDVFLNIGNINALREKRGLEFLGFGLENGKPFMIVEVI